MKLAARYFFGLLAGFYFGLAIRQPHESLWLDVLLFVEAIIFMVIAFRIRVRPHGKTAH